MDNPTPAVIKTSTQPTVIKTKCTLTKENRKRPFENVQGIRGFQLQLPSTTKLVPENSINIVGSNIMYSDAMGVLSNTEFLQKLRILSPGGKDLGEFKVKLKSSEQESPSNENTNTLTKPNITFMGTSTIFSPRIILPTKIVPRILRPNTRKIPKSNSTERISYKSIVQTDKSRVSQQPMFLPVKRMFLNNQDVEGKAEKQNSNSNSINTDKVPSVDGIHSKHKPIFINNQAFVLHGIDSVPTTVEINNQKLVVRERDDINSNCTKKIQETATENSKASSATEAPLHKEIVESPNCKRFMMNCGDKSNIPLSGKNLKISKGKCIATIKSTENGKIVTSLKSANVIRRCNQSDKNLNHDSLHNDIKTYFNNGEISYDKDNSLQTKSDAIPKTQISEVKTQNVMTVIPNNKTISFNQNTGLAQENNTAVASVSTKNMVNVDHSTVRYDTECDNTQSKGRTEFQNEYLVIIDGQVKRILKPQQFTDIIANVQNKNSSQNMSDRLNIIKKAMDSVKDDKLRELALKALADCGIGIERYVPIRPPENHKAVHDTQVQTVVFGLLDPKSFVLINKDLEDIHRLNQITLHHTPNDKNLSANLHSNNSMSKNSNVIDPNVIEQENSFDLDNFMEQLWKEDSDALKMKETLSKTRIRCNSLLEHLQRDFECVTQYDQDGMLNIHKAVISDNVYHVRRQLMVLEHCKQSVDILTEDGVTSLELAIKYDVCNEIVKLLLDAGAQPVIPSSIRESAVIIASKQSSPLLSMLVSRVSNSKLLNQIDLNGLAAIHYCSIHGNLQGVKLLISAGAAVDLKDRKSGRTALFHAIDNGETSVMQVLLKAGAIASIANYAGQTPLSILTDPKSLVYQMIH